MRIGETWFYLEDNTPENHVKALWDIWGQESSVVIPDILLQYEGEEPRGRGVASEL